MSDDCNTVTIGYKGIGYKGKSLKWETFQSTLYYVLYMEEIGYKGRFSLPVGDPL